jgi:hypothetical protein
MEDSWIYIEGKRDGRAYMAHVRHPLEAWRNAEYEHHVAVTLDYAPHWRTGMPGPNELTRLQDFEERVSSHLEGHGVLAGSETSGGKRIVHLYVRGGGPVLELYRKLERGGKKGGVTVRVTGDAEWSDIDHLAQASVRASARAAAAG